MLVFGYQKLNSDRITPAKHVRNQLMSGYQKLNPGVTDQKPKSPKFFVFDSLNKK